MGMGSEQEILRKLEELSGRMDSGFKGISGAISDLERRLCKQEKKIRKTAKLQSVQGEELAKLKKVVKDLAESTEARKYGSDIAIRKEPAYKGFEECGVRKRAAMTALRDAGVIRADSQNKNTCVVKMGGKVERVIVVCMDNA